MTADREAVHAPGPEPHWHEAHRLDAVFPAARVALALQIASYPNRGHATFHGAMIRLGDDPVVVVEFDVPLPSHGWEIRASGLWADHICETPMEHWSYGLEAFGLSIDDPRELLGAAVGERVPLGWELEFEARAAAQSTGGAERYGQIGSVHGLLLERDGTTEVDGYGVRSHWWGIEPPSQIQLGDPADDAAETVVLPAIDGVWELFVNESGTSARWLPADVGPPLRP